jgi:hypothetical protein
LPSALELVGIIGVGERAERAFETTLHSSIELVDRQVRERGEIVDCLSDDFPPCLGIPRDLPGILQHLRCHRHLWLTGSMGARR